MGKNILWFQHLKREDLLLLFVINHCKVHFFGDTLRRNIGVWGVLMGKYLIYDDIKQEILTFENMESLNV